MTSVSPSPRRAGAVRVPAPTVLFWIAKAASTALGEAVSDLSIRVMPPVLAVLLGFVFFVGALTLQLTRRRYVPAVYWLAVAAVAVFGTMAADVLHVVAGLPYAVTAAGCAVLLGVVFLAWRRVEGDLSVHAVTTSRAELFYWAAVIGTFAMGTALGDLAARDLGLGYAASAALFAAVIAACAIGHRFLRWNAVASFWIAYMMTRPLGASVADGLGKPVAEGGAGFGATWTALAFALLMLAATTVMIVRDARGASGSGRATALGES